MKDQNNTHPIKSYLLLYTGILFAVHLGVYAISLITGDNIYIFPLIFVQNEGILMIILNLPFILLCDFIITGTILSFIFYFKKMTGFPGLKEVTSLGKIKVEKYQ